jgi:hypothetical protein
MQQQLGGQPPGLWHWLPFWAQPSAAGDPGSVQGQVIYGVHLPAHWFSSDHTLSMFLNLHGEAAGPKMVWGTATGVGAAGDGGWPWRQQPALSGAVLLFHLPSSRQHSALHELPVHWASERSPSQARSSGCQMSRAMCCRPPCSGQGQGRALGVVAGCQAAAQPSATTHWAGSWPCMAEEQ